MKKAQTIVSVAMLFGLLIAIRAFEGALFYDPLISFFKLDHSTQLLPEMDTLKLIGNVTLRFWMNSIISLGILWLLFRNKEILKVSSLLYILVFVVLLIAFVSLIGGSPSAGGLETTQEEAGGHLALFYVRRFLIQPLFLLLLIPAFYFQRKS